MTFEREEALLHGQYELTEVLGQGAFGLVLGGRHRDIDQRVAVKRIDSRGTVTDVARRLRVEARILARLHHPHILRIYSYATDGELHLLVMERLDGGTLRGYFRDHGRSVLDVCAAGVVVGAALDAAHAQGVVHRDVKPDNVLVAADGTFKVADFGIAKVLQEATGAGSTGAGSTEAGTPLYAAPEQLSRGRVTPAADIYALGVMLFELFSGRPPFTGSFQELCHQHCHVPPPPLGEVSDIPPVFAAVVARALSKDPAQRQQSGRELAIDLGRAVTRTYGPGRLGTGAVPIYVDNQMRAALVEVAPGSAPGGVLVVPPPGGWRGLDSRDADLYDAGNHVVDRHGAPTALVGGDWPRPPVGETPEPSGPTPRGGEPRGGPDGGQRRTALVVLSDDGGYQPLDGGDGGDGEADNRPRRLARVRPRARRRKNQQQQPEPVLVPDVYGIAAGPDGSLYVSQPSHHIVLRITPEGEVFPVLGTGEAGFSDGPGSARMARVDTPYGLAVDAEGVLYVADSGNGLLRRVDPERDLVETAAGGGERRSRTAAAAPHAEGSEVTPADLRLRGARGVAVDVAGRILIASTERHRVYRLERDGGRVDLVVGTGSPGDSGDGGPAERARLCRPYGVAAHPDGRVVIADTGNHRLRAVAPDGRITTLAGGRYQPPPRPQVPVAPTRIQSPTAVVVRSDGRIVLSCAPPHQHPGHRFASGLGPRIVELGIPGRPSAPAPAVATGPTPARPAPDSPPRIASTTPATPTTLATGTHGLLTSPAGLAYSNQNAASGMLLVAQPTTGRIIVLGSDGRIGVLAVLDRSTW